jgi:DNA-binding transcriptional ArsR family regulator
MDVFAALADPVRRAILLRLAQAPARVVDLAADHDISRPAVSKHLRLLGEAGLVTAETRGRERHYRLVPAGVAPVQDLLTELTSPRVRIHETTLDALDLEVRRTTRERRDRAVDHGTDTPTKETG